MEKQLSKDHLPFGDSFETNLKKNKVVKKTSSRYNVSPPGGSVMMPTTSTKIRRAAMKDG
jgi:hypothetical protein